MRIYLDEEKLEKALDKSKLVQVERQVQGKNGTFTRKQWVKASDVKKTDVVIGGAQNQDDSKEPLKLPKNQRLEWSKISKEVRSKIVSDAKNEFGQNYDIGWSTPSYARSGNTYTSTNCQLYMGYSSIGSIYVDTSNPDKPTVKYSVSVMNSEKGTDKEIKKQKIIVNAAKAIQQDIDNQMHPKNTVSKNKSESSSKKDENTSENRRKLKAEIDDYVHKHNPPTDADRKKVSAMRDKYNAWMKEESDRLKKQAQEQYNKTPDKAEKPKNDKSSDNTKTKTPDEEFIDSKFNYAYKDDMSMPKKVEKIQVGDKTGYIVTREVQRDGGDHSYSGTVYSAVIDGKAIKASDDETPINLEDNTAFKTRDDCLKALKAQGKNTSDKQPAKADNTKADTTTKKPSVDAKSLVKKMSADQAEQFAKDNNITWTKNDHSGINTMRMKMAIQSAIEDGSVEAPDLGNMPSKPTKTDKSSTGAKKPQDDAKKAVQDAIGKNPDRAKAMEKFKANGITWKESDKEGINWMRAMMAATKHVADGGKIEDNASGAPAKSETKPKLSDPTTPTKPSDIKVGDYIYYEDNEGAGGIKGVTQVKDIKTVVVPKTGKTMYIFNQYGRHDRVACTESKTVKKYN